MPATAEPRDDDVTFGQQPPEAAPAIRPPGPREGRPGRPGREVLSGPAPAAPDRALRRRDFLRQAGAGAAAAQLAACRSKARGGPIVLRLSHSMTPGATALDAFAEAFRELAYAATRGAVELRVFSSNTLGQEREVVQQLQEGLVDFMVSGTAIWGSVAPKLQVFDFPFLWRDWEHVHGVVDGAVGRQAADYMERAVQVRPLAWGDSFGFRQVITRSRAISEPAELRGLKLRTIQSPIYVKAVELMGASPTPMAFGEVYTSLQTGVIDGYEHDASTTLQQRFFEVARFMARTRHIAGVLGLFASAVGLARLPAGLRPKLEAAALEAARRQRAMGDLEDRSAAEGLVVQGMTIRDIDRGPFLEPAAGLWRAQARELDAGPWLRAALD